jgi:hypothetical protein
MAVRVGPIKRGRCGQGLGSSSLGAVEGAVLIGQSWLKCQKVIMIKKKAIDFLYIQILPIDFCFLILFSFYHQHTRQVLEHGGLCSFC